ncbi:hypothetical protein GCM10027614_18190 [Micromonospora vulcania]
MSSTSSAAGIRARVATVLAGVLLMALPGTPVAAAPAIADPAAPAQPGPPHIVGEQTVPAYSYADAIRESVWVQTRADTDGDGVRDRVAVDLVRPREAAARGSGYRSSWTPRRTTCAVVGATRASARRTTRPA